jgi:hypothetical protein
MKGTGFIVWALILLVVTILIPVAAQQGIGAYGDKTAAGLHLWAVVTFLADLLAVTLIVLGFGYAVTGKCFGIAMSSWNDYSLSKLQMALWTILVIAALFTTAKLNLLGYFGPMPLPADASPGMIAGEPLGISIPGELLAAMGIAAFSTAATPAILSLKASQTPADGEVQAATQRTADQQGAATMSNAGKAAGHASTDSAGWLDVVTGDEVANAGVVDLSKVQQLLVTILLIGTYTFMLIRTFSGAKTGINSLPELGPRFVELMGISHAGYLAYKATPKSGSTAPAPAASDNATSASGVPVRLTVDDAATIAGLTLTLDNAPVAVGASGFVEVSLSPGKDHTFAARGTRNGNAVTGTLVMSVTPNDTNKPLAISLV